MGDCDTPRSLCLVAHSTLLLGGMWSTLVHQVNAPVWGEDSARQENSDSQSGKAGADRAAHTATFQGKSSATSLPPLSTHSTSLRPGLPVSCPLCLTLCSLPHLHSPGPGPVPSPLPNSQSPGPALPSHFPRASSPDNESSGFRVCLYLQGQQSAALQTRASAPLTCGG